MKILTSAVISAAMALSLAACDPVKSSPAPSAPAAHSVHGLETATGALVGASGHATSGTASVFRVDGQWYVSLGSDFAFDGAPDPQVALGHDGYRKEASLGALTSNYGAQAYAIPASLDVADFNEIWIWCDQFAVPLGSAKLRLL